MTEKFSEFVSYIMTIMSNISLYSIEHPSIADLSSKALSSLDNLFVDDSVSIVLLGRSLMVNDTTITDKGVHIENFSKKLRINGIEKIIIKRGVRPEELQTLLSQMAMRKETPRSSEHISIGVIQVRFKADESDVLELIDENISRIKDTYQEISRFKKLDIISLEEVVIGFISAIKKESNILRVVSPVKSYSEYTYVHAANVSTLTLFQAEFLGLKGESLYDAGIAGLLHDVGKMFIPKEIIEKKGRLDESEWNEIKKHPVQGALYLSMLKDVPKLAVIVAFEHHMKYNGTGYPETKRRGKKQHIISQLVAISDFFDAIKTERSYRKSMETQEVIGLMKESSGRDFNPHLVDNFIKALSAVGVF